MQIHLLVILYFSTPTSSRTFCNSVKSMWNHTRRKKPLFRFFVMRLGHPHCNFLLLVLIHFLYLESCYIFRWNRVTFFGTDFWNLANKIMYISYFALLTGAIFMVRWFYWPWSTELRCAFKRLSLLIVRNGRWRKLVCILSFENF